MQVSQVVVDAERLLYDVPIVVSTPLVIDPSHGYIRKIYKLADARSFLIGSRHDLIYSSMGQLWERGERRLLEWMYEQLVPTYQDVMRVKAKSVLDMGDAELLVWCWRTALIILPAKSMWHTGVEYDALVRPVVSKGEEDDDEPRSRRISKATIARNGYFILPAEVPTGLPKQAKALVEVLLAKAGHTLSEEELASLLNKAVVSGQIKTKQPITRVFGYYRQLLMDKEIIKIA